MYRYSSLADQFPAEFLFQTATDHPADPRLILRKSRRRGHGGALGGRSGCAGAKQLERRCRLRAVAHFADRETTGHVEQQARISEEAGPATEGRKPRQFRLIVDRGRGHEVEIVAGCRSPGSAEKEVAAAALAGPLGIGFETQHPFRVHLPIVADLTSGEPAIDLLSRIEGSKRRSDGNRLASPAPAVAAVDTDVETRPVISGIDNHRGRLGVGPWRKIGCEGGRRENARHRGAGNRNANHVSLKLFKYFHGEIYGPSAPDGVPAGQQGN